MGQREQQEAEGLYLLARARREQTAAEVFRRAAFGTTVTRATGTMTGDIAAINSLLSKDPIPTRGRPGATMAGDLVAIQKVLDSGDTRSAPREENEMICFMCGQCEIEDCMC
ncbi:unnamed protein product [Gemmata massiliana]|uniref:Uncharacterized protein n=1 Tax=Gemmata massiliana TaxID=1210884 RepID=A0A6P2CTZ6_9BACT|nr:hypothetical protein [Gemmata massiliana]VTR91856.1 unnamed protein product [Gemmata massiliana]